MCASADQLLFGSRSGGPGSASQSALGVRGDLAPGAVCGPTRTLFQPATEGPELGALPGGADQEALGSRGFDPAGAVAGAGALSCELGSFLGGAEVAPWQKTWKTSHD